MCEWRVSMYICDVSRTSRKLLLTMGSVSEEQPYVGVQMQALTALHEHSWDTEQLLMKCLFIFYHYRPIVTVQVAQILLSCILIVCVYM